MSDQSDSRPVATETPSAVIGSVDLNATDTSHQQVVEFQPDSMEVQVQDPENIIPVRPEHVTDERNAEIIKEATMIANAIIENPSNVEITSKLYALGDDVMSSNTTQVELMDSKIGPVLDEINVESPVQRSLIGVKAQLDLVNPNVVANTEHTFSEEDEVPVLGISIFGWKPFGTKIVNNIVTRLPAGQQQVMELINERRDTVKTTVDGLKNHLWTERDKALQNAVQLGVIANELASTQDELQEASYQGSLIWEQLIEARKNESDPVRDNALLLLTNDLATLVVDIETVDQLNIQSRMGAEVLINNCRNIERLVNRITKILLPSVANALAVKAAGAQQANLAAASKQVMEAASDTIAQTAKDIHQTSVALATMNAEGMVNIEKLEEAADEYEKMQAELAEIMNNAERNARGISNRMTEVNARMRSHADPLTQARQAKEAANV